MNINVKQNSLVYKFFLFTLYKTKDRAKAQKSKFEYTARPNGVYALRVIGLLHGLFGLTLKYDDVNMEFQNWLAFWFESSLTFDTFKRSDNDDFSQLLVTDMKNAGYVVIKKG